MNRLASIALLLVFVPLFSPGAIAHGVSSQLEVETELLKDEGEDGLAVVDGHDLWDLYAREVHLAEHGDGLVFRFTLYTDFAPVAQAETLHIDLGFEGPDGARAFRISTTNAAQWTGDGSIVEVEYVGGEISETNIQWFLSYEDAGARPGDNLTSFWMESYADDQLVDVAPGGLYVAGQAEVPTESIRVNEALALVGPVGYTKTDVAFTDGVVEVHVQNPFQESGQHLGLHLDVAGNWVHMVEHVHDAPVESGQSFTWRLGVNPPSERTTAGIEITSDLGGFELWTIDWRPDEVLMYPGPERLYEQPEPETEESPASPLAAGLIALAALAFRRRR